MFENLFKSERRRELERNITIQRSLSNFRQTASKYEQLERRYTEKAVQAKKSGDAANYRNICKMLAGAMNFRRYIESQTLAFETILIQKDQAALAVEFARGMSALTKNVQAAYSGVNLEQVLHDVEATEAKVNEMQNVMGIVTDRIMSQQDFNAVPEGGMSVDTVENMIAEKVALETGGIDKQIESSLNSLRETLKNTEQKQ
ncbi:hypothetical protein FACS18942_07060 [Planctomycetales bacterium]|nr:hypothetical protein FACS18942_07060 [Planctomycetales bacterium]